MACETWREAISALADGEDPGVDGRLLDAHLARCGGCRAFQSQVVQIRGTLRVRAAAAMPDLSRRIVKLNALVDRAGRWRVVRALLAVVALEILVLSVPALIWGEEAATSEHAARHLGAFTAAYGAALLVVAARPARARTVLPVAATLAGALLITAAVDVSEGRAPLLGETLHVPEILSVVLVWLLAAPAWRLAPSQALGGRAASALRIVDEPDEMGDREPGASSG
ncbi:MAG: zf-HC2 domain-containing protein [Acidimicrobiales bacterium]